jgi:predicted transcriptional regulator
VAEEQSWKIDEKTLSKKYSTDVKKLIRAWKRGLTDQDIATKTGIKPTTLYMIKQDLELAHRRLRLAQKKQALVQDQALVGQYQIFFNPHL